MLWKTNKRTKEMSMVTKDDWVHVCQNVKYQCTFVAKGLIAKFNKQLSAQHLMNAMCIIYLQYCLQLEVTSMFLSHLQILKTHYCHARMTQPNGVCHPPLLDATLFEHQSSFLLPLCNQIIVLPWCPHVIVTLPFACGGGWPIARF